MKKILLILLIGCTLQCIAQHHRDFDTEKEFLEFLYKNSNKIKADPDDYFDEGVGDFIPAPKYWQYGWEEFRY